MKKGDRVTVLTYQDARPAYHGEIIDVFADGYDVLNDETTEKVVVPKSFVVPETKPGSGTRLSGEFVGSALESSFPMDLMMSGLTEPIHVDYVVCEVPDEDPGDRPEHEFKINIGTQWFTVTVRESEA